VLGLVEVLEPATPYDLKRFAEVSVFNFWTVPHTQVYAECGRLAEAGLLDERREETGRRRRIYRLTSTGRRALEDWRGTSEPAFGLELRDEGLLKLFFGAEPRALARVQLEGHRAKLREYQQLAEHVPDMPEGQRLALEAGIRCESTFVDFWSNLITD
jgi:DNA-binding PadR family transcriptional regulator